MHLYPDIGLQAAIDQALAQAHAVPGDDFSLLQPRQARVDGGASDTQMAGKGGDAFAGVDLQQGDQLVIDFIEGDWAGIRHGESLQWAC
ncbi:hypothetical protein D3C79_900790 [compost metagenome]